MICSLCHKNIRTVIAKELRGGEKSPVFYCSNCQLGMLGSPLSQRELKNFYDKSYRKTASPKLGMPTNPQELFEAAVSFQSDRLRLLKERFSKKKRLLEIGCSAGMFLWHARDYVREVVGIDYDSRSAKFASRKCGCKVYTTDIEQTDLKENSFDIICAFQTLEHAKDPVDFVRKYKKYLKRGGTMAIEVPNLRDALLYAYNLPNHKKFFFHASHLWYFTEKSLSRLMKSCSFKGSIYYIQDYNIFNQMNWVINDEPQPSPIPGLSEPFFNFRKGIEPQIKSALNNFINEANLAYKKKLTELKITSNIFYIGKIK